MDYEKEYKDALERAKKYYNERITLGHTRDVIKEIFPEVKDDENERIKNSLIRWFKNCDSPYFAGFELSKIVDWLEKQESVGEIVERCKNSWYNEGKIAGMAEGLTEDEKYQQGWHDALEKQGKQKPISDIKHKVSAGGSLIIVNEKPFDYEHASITQKDFAPINDTDEEIVEAVKDTSVLDMVEQKQEWSDEDMSKVQRICKYLDEAKKYYADITEVRECINWLKSLKDKIKEK